VRAEQTVLKLRSANAATMEGRVGSGRWRRSHRRGAAKDVYFIATHAYDPPSTHRGFIIVLRGRGNIAREVPTGEDKSR
jgi:hypothetical protein